MNPYYQDEHVTLYLGDCLEVDAWLTADVLVTDPPYGIGWKQSFSKDSGGQWWKDALKVGIVNDHDTAARDAALSMWGSRRPALCFGSLNSQYPHGWTRVLVFQKPVVACGLVGNRKPWLANWEPVFVLGEWPKQTPRRSSVIATRRPAAGGYSGYITAAGHSHAKPLDVMEELLDACPPGVIADPFAGSGSTLIAARNLGRKAIGVEIEERYCELIASRLSQGAFDFEEPA